VAFAATLAQITGCGGGSTGSPAPVSVGSLTVVDCVIAAGGSSCDGSVSWTSNAAAPRVIVAGLTLATTASGSATPAVDVNRRAVTLFDGATRLDEKSVGGACAPASAWNGTKCSAFAVRTSERAPTPFFEAGLAVTLEVVIYRPLGNGPYPVLMFNHGSTGNGDDPSQFRLTYTNEQIARYFNERGWMVAFPQRRGRGASDGQYDEGFTPDRSRYSCLQGPALAGLERAVQDVDAAYDYLRARQDVDPTRVISGGVSRGGILAMVHAARRPPAFIAAINFVGGWLGEGCTDAIAVNRGAFVSAASFPNSTLWLYGENDPFYSVAHSRANFDAFTIAGGRGSFNVYLRDAGLSGHLIINDPALWAPDLDVFLRQVGS
jgi:dienelactone hydrolase